jgi:PAS domain S-box-containing protein
MALTGTDLLAVLNVSPEAMLVVDRAAAILEANDAICQLSGYSRDELIGNPIDLLVPERLLGLRARTHYGFLTQPQRQTMANGAWLFLRAKSGAEVPVQTMLGPLGSGDNLRVVVSLRDASVCKDREEQLRATIDDLDRRLRSSQTDFRRTNEHFKLFLKHAPAAIALVDRQLRYLIVSDRWLEEFELEGRDVHGLSHYDMFPEVPEIWRDQHRRCLAGEVVKSDEGSFRRADGRVEWVRRELHPWRTPDGRVGGMLMFVEMITARKNAELALKKSHQELELRVAERTAELERMKNDATRANAQKSWFVAAASHDLRQPLQASLAYLSVLARRAARDDLEDLCNKARQPLKAMSDILDVLLDISELESGHVQPHRQDFLLGDLLARVIAGAQYQAQEKGLRLSCLPTELSVHSDPKLLERVITNFVVNAIRYTEKGLIGIYCEAAGDKVCVSVSDTGIGIPADSLATIFEDHIQLANPARDRRKGLGLGLSIAKRIADALGHRISVQSELGSGSSFSIELPQTHAAAKHLPAAPAAPAVAVDFRPVVLLIDDDQDVAEAMQMLLQSYAFETYKAQSCEAAMAMLEAGLLPGLLLCDYRMPCATGAEVIRRVRDMLHSEIPAVIMTGDMGLTEPPADLARCALLHKPVDVETFLSVIGKLAA